MSTPLQSEVDTYLPADATAVPDAAESVVSPALTPISAALSSLTPSPTNQVAFSPIPDSEPGVLPSSSDSIVQPSVQLPASPDEAPCEVPSDNVDLAASPSPADDRPASRESGVGGSEHDAHNDSFGQQYGASPLNPPPAPPTRSLGVQTQVVVVKHGELASS